MTSACRELMDNDHTGTSRTCAGGPGSTLEHVRQIVLAFPALSSNARRWLEKSVIYPEKKQIVCFMMWFQPCS